MRRLLRLAGAALARLSARAVAGASVALLVALVLASGAAALLAGGRTASLPPLPTATAPGASATPSPPGTPGAAWMDALRDGAERAYVDDLIARMPLDEELGQMLVSEFNGTSYTPDIAAKIQRYH